LKQNIGVVNWFTKKQENISYPEQSENMLELLSEEISRIFNHETYLNKAADAIYHTFKTSDLKQICSDSRLPVCSLYHHLRNTSGIAVCLMMQKMDIDTHYISRCLAEYGISVNYSKKDFKGLIRIASLLHDFGKLRSYTASSRDKPYHYHTTQTKEILEEILKRTDSNLVKQYELKKILPKLAANHHTWNENTQLERLISSADTVASATDRRYDIKAEYGEGTVTAQSMDKIFPHELNFDTGDIKCLDSPSTEILAINQSTSKSVEIITDESSIKLFEDSVVHGGTIHYQGHSKQLSGSIGLLSLDTMGIQGFINEAEKLPMLRGGSAIVEDVLERAKEIISKEVCEEAILFAGGGNLLSFTPDIDMFNDEIKNEIEINVNKISNGGLRAAVVTCNQHLDFIARNFSEVLDNSQKRLEEKKNETRSYSVISNEKELCGYCFKRQKPHSSEKCSVCKAKESKGIVKKYSEQIIANTHGLVRPTELTEIGDSIAVLIVDGNMMGRLFQQTTTPAEYNFKSETFSQEFESIIRETIDDFISNDDRRDKLIKHTVENNEYLGIDVLYIGGDDALIIMNAKGAIAFSELLIKRVSDRLKFKTEFGNGILFENPTVTISCGIAIADSHFPIYFLLNSARDMESKAKIAFRKATYTDDFGFIKIPDGALAVTAISSAMPTGECYSFVIGSSQTISNGPNLARLIEMVDMAIDAKTKPLITDIITCGNEEIDRLNLLKSMYSSIQRKKDFGLDECEILAKVLLDRELMDSMKLIVPHVWAGQIGGE